MVCLLSARRIGIKVVLLGIIVVLAHMPARAADRLGGTVFINMVDGRDLAAFHSWMEDARVNQGLPFGALSRERGIGGDLIIFKGVSARAGLGGYYSVAFNDVRDARDTTWSATSDHFGIEMFYAWHVVPAPGLRVPLLGGLLPYLGVGTGVDINSFSIKREKASLALEEGSFMGMSMLGSINLVFGIDIVWEKYMLGVRGTYRHLRTSRLELKTAGERAFYGSALIPTAESYRSSPNDPTRWTPLEWDPSNLNIAVVFTFHQRLQRAPGLN